MRIITEPRVSLFSSQIFHPVEGYPIPDDGDNPTKIGSFCAKVAYRSFGEQGRSNTENQERIIESHHGRILEHMVFGLHVAGISRALSLELLTHVTGISKSQESTRYVNMEDAAIVLEPYYAGIYESKMNVTGGPKANDRNDDEVLLVDDFLSSAATAFREYELEVERLMDLNPLGLSGVELRKWARGKARNILPHALETRMVLTGNLRAWRNFVESRSERHAEDEIRRLAHHVFQVLQPLAPLYFQDYTTEIIRGIPEYQTVHRKV